MDQIKMGKFIKELRQEKGLTQKEIGDKLKITDNSISKWERGINTPDIYYLAPLSKILGVSINELLNGERNYRKKNKKNNRHKILEVENLNKSFGKNKILNDINITIYESDIVGLIGPNGAGKTTLIKTILNLYYPNNGKIKICGYEIKKDFELVMFKVSSLVETPDLYQNLSGLQNLKMTTIMNNIKDYEYMEKIIKLLKLNNRINDKVKKYSLGMKQRLALANALIKKPQFLILDEPTNGLDPLGIKELRDIIKFVNESFNTTILISSHILSEIENICDEIIIIDNGYIIEQLDISDIKYQNISLEKEFLNKTSGSKNQIGGEL